MKKYLIEALSFAIYGLASGVYYREFTKANSFTGRTTLAFAHPHILALGLGGLLIIAIIFKLLNIKENKLSKTSNICYVAGLGITSLMMIIKGSLEVKSIVIEKPVSTILSVFSGLSHIALATGIILFLVLFILEAKNK